MTVAKFEGASAIVSGGAGGLGEATVRRLHAEGLGVVIADLAADKGKALADELGGGALFVSTDVTSDDSVQGAIEQANQLGRLRYAVVAHGGFGVAQRIVQRDGSPADMAGFTKTINLYLNGTYNLTRLVAASVAAAEPREDGERGAIVMTASAAPPCSGPLRVPTALTTAECRSLRVEAVTRAAKAEAFAPCSA